MVTITIDAGNLYITNGSISGNDITTTGNQKVVKIDCTKIDYNYNNEIMVVPIPLSKQIRTSTTAYARAIDLKRIKETVAVQGFISDELGNSAVDKRNDIITLGKTGGGLIAVWGRDYGTEKYQTLFDPSTSPYGVFILSMVFTETAGFIGSAVGTAGQEPSERSIAIQIQLVRGKDM